MTARLKVTHIFAFFLFSGLLFWFNSVEASVYNYQPDYSGEVSGHTTCGTSPCTQNGLASSTIANSGFITSIKIKMRIPQGICDIPDYDTKIISMSIVDNLSVSYGATNSFIASDVCSDTDFTDLTFNFSSTSTIDLSEELLDQVRITTESFNNSIYKTSGTSVFSDAQFNGDDKDLYMIISTNGSDVNNVAWVQMSPIYFPNQMSTRDFQYWVVNFYAPENATYKIKVNYGTSSPPSTYYDQTIPVLVSSGHKFDIKVSKSQSLTPGDWYVFSELYDWNDNLIATDDLIMKFTVLSGSNTFNVPDNQTIYDVVDCPDTDTDYLGVDWGQGICKVSRFLFIPSAGTEQKLNSALTTINGKAPFSYVSEINTIINNNASSTASALPSIAIRTSATSSIPNLNITLFSTSTLSSNYSTYGFSVLRTLANILLYVAFGYMCYSTAIHLANKKGN